MTWVDFLGKPCLSKFGQNELFQLLLKLAQSGFVDIWCVVTGHETR